MAALVDKLEADRTGVTLVNLNPSRERVVTVQGGAYGEHVISTVHDGHQAHAVNGRSFDVKLAPGCGARLDARDAALRGESDAGLSLGQLIWLS